MLNIDQFGRKINYLRISVTDRCNLRCIYCLTNNFKFKTRTEILSFEEIYEVAKIMIEFGIRNFKITGGEPLIRKDLPVLIKLLSSLENVNDISLTTNGILLKNFISELKDAGLKRINISLDTLDKEKFKKISEYGEIEDVLEGIHKAFYSGFNPIKINVVVMKNINDEEIADFVDLSVRYPLHIKFIELMPLDDLNFQKKFFVSTHQIKNHPSLSDIIPLSEIPVGFGPAKYFKKPNSKGTIGFISPITEKNFCDNCNKIRLTSDGFLKLCLASDIGIDLKKLFRNNKSLKNAILSAFSIKPQKHNFNYESISTSMCAIGG